MLLKQGWQFCRRLFSRLPNLKFLVFGILALGLLAVGVYYLPPVHARLAWRVEALLAQIQNALHPPEQVIFVPQEQTTPLTPAFSTPIPTFTPTPNAAISSTPVPITPKPTASPTLSPTPIPTAVSLSGAIHEYQQWNNCGPATLSMALSFWKWKGDQRDTAAFLKPNARDKNVFAEELQAFVEQKTGLKAMVRVGGDLNLLKRFIAAGFPVIVEKGFEIPKEAWMGHYSLLTGYNDVRQTFMTQDAYIMANLPVPYAEQAKYWQHFNYVYLVIYPPEREAEVLSILGPQADVQYNYQSAARRAETEIQTLTGRDRYFAWYNLGSSRVGLADYAGAAAAYDQAFALYPALSEAERPWRLLWYQIGPYLAYFHTARYKDVINLATVSVNCTVEPALEESFYWRARAKAALADQVGAVADYRLSLQWHPNYAPSLEQLKLLGVEP